MLLGVEADDIYMEDTDLIRWHKPVIDDFVNLGI